MTTTLPENNPRMQLLIGWMHGAYFILTGIWPPLHMRSFIAITGPKTDLWLVRTVGILAAAIGISIASAIARKDVRTPTVLLAIISAIGLMTIDIVYATTNTISKIYLADAALEIVLVIGSLIQMRTKSQRIAFGPDRTR